MGTFSSLLNCQAFVCSAGGACYGATPSLGRSDLPLGLGRARDCLSPGLTLGRAEPLGGQTPNAVDDVSHPVGFGEEHCGGVEVFQAAGKLWREARYDYQDDRRVMGPGVRRNMNTVHFAGHSNIGE